MYIRMNYMTSLAAQVLCGILLLDATCAQHSDIICFLQKELKVIWTKVVGVSWQFPSTVFLYYQPLYAWLLYNKA